MPYKMPTHQTYTLQLLNLGAGALDPAQRVKLGEITNREIDRLVSWLETSQPYEAVDIEPIPTRCMDGRKNGRTEPCFSAAGGTFSLVMGDALTHQSYRHKGETAPQHARRLYAELIKKNYPVGTHDDEHRNENDCGCGAEDRLDSADPTRPSILRYISRRGSDIRSLLNSNLDLHVDDDLHKQIVANAQHLIDEHYATHGAELRKASIDIAGAGSVATHKGNHQEVVLVLNTQDGITLNRQKLYAEFGELYQVFMIDIAALKKAMECIALSSSEAYEKFVAALYFNIATVAVLVGPSFSVVIR